MVVVVGLITFALVQKKHGLSLGHAAIQFWNDNYPLYLTRGPGTLQTPDPKVLTYSMPIHIGVGATNERLLSAGVVFGVGLAAKSHWM